MSIAHFVKHCCTNKPFNFRICFNFFSGFSNSFISSCGNSFSFKIVLTMLIWFIYSSCEHVCDFTVRKYPKPAVFFIFHTDIGVNGNYIEFRFILSKNSSCWICTLGYEIRYYKANSLERWYRIHHWIPMFFGKILLPIPFFRHPSCVRKGLESRLSRLQLWPISPNPGWACFSLKSGAKTSWWWCSVLWGIIFHQHMCGHFPMFPLLKSKIFPPPPFNMLFLSDSPFWDKSLTPPPSICCHMDMIFQAAVKYTVSESFSTYNSSNF